MAEIKAQPQTEPDPAATSIGNDQTLNPTAAPELTSDVSPAPTTSEDAKKAEETTAQRMLATLTLSSFDQTKILQRTAMPTKM